MGSGFGQDQAGLLSEIEEPAILPDWAGRDVTEEIGIVISVRL